MVRGAANNTNFTVIDYAESQVETILDSYLNTFKN